MSDVLEQILAHKRGEVESARAARSIDELRATPGFAHPVRNFYGAVAAPRRGGPNLIAEVKKSSPSAGLICADFDPVRIARTYEAAGAAALSVLTDRRFFGGDPAFLEQIKEAVGLPLLRKDFVIDEYQVWESRSLGADAILLIAEALPAAPLADLAALARSIGLAVLVEVHSRATLFDVLQAIPATARDGLLLGINNRDLARQVVDLAVSEELASHAPPGIPLVAESGIRTRRDVERMHAAGARAVLVGEVLMRSGDPARTIAELFGPPSAA